MYRVLCSLLFTLFLTCPPSVDPKYWLCELCNAKECTGTNVVKYIKLRNELFPVNDHNLIHNIEDATVFCMNKYAEVGQTCRCEEIY